MIRACIRCGSRDLRIPGLADGVVPETDNLGAWVCRACGWQDIPVEFEAKADYEAFLQALADA